jgi:hypothetical protein
MTERVVVRPKKGLKIPMPGTAHLPEEARLLPADGLTLDLPLSPEMDLWLERRRAQEEVDVEETKGKPKGRKATGAQNPPPGGEADGAAVQPAPENEGGEAQ